MECDSFFLNINLKKNEVGNKSTKQIFTPYRLTYNSINNFKAIKSKCYSIYL